MNFQWTDVSSVTQVIYKISLLSANVYVSTCCTKNICKNKGDTFKVRIKTLIFILTTETYSGVQFYREQQNYSQC